LNAATGTCLRLDAQRDVRGPAVRIGADRGLARGQRDCDTAVPDRVDGLVRAAPHGRPDRRVADAIRSGDDHRELLRSADGDRRMRRDDRDARVAPGAGTGRLRVIAPGAEQRRDDEDPLRVHGADRRSIDTGPADGADDAAGRR